MKNLIFLYLTFYFITFASFAEDKKIQVQIVDPYINSKSFDSKYQVNRDNRAFTTLPDKKLRDEALNSSEATKNWDELQKDIFYMDLKNNTIANLGKKYPKIKKDELIRLKEKTK